MALVLLFFKSISYPRFGLSKLNENIKEQIEHLLETSRLGFNEETKRVGILFSPYLVDMRGFTK